MIEIEVCERLTDHRYVPLIVEGKFEGTVPSPTYHAQIKDKPGYWSSGSSPSEAIGALIRSHSEVFGILLTCIESKLAR